MAHEVMKSDSETRRLHCDTSMKSDVFAIAPIHAVSSDGCM